jgi:hypothetical protein
MTYVVLIPCPLGYCLFVRWPRQSLRTCTNIVDPVDLRDTVRSLGDPLAVVLVGRRNADAVSDAVLDAAELFIIPDSWLRRVPRRALTSRAELAVRIASAQRAATLEHRLRKDLQLDLPF